MPYGGQPSVAAHIPVPASIIAVQAQLELARSREEASGAEQGQVTARAELQAVQEDCARLRWVYGWCPRVIPAAAGRVREGGFRGAV